MFADLLRGPWRLRRQARPRVLLLSNNLGTHWLRAVFILEPGSLRTEWSGLRGNPAHPGILMHPLPPFVCEAGPLGSGSFDEGGVPMHQDRADRPDRPRPYVSSRAPLGM